MTAGALGILMFVWGFLKWLNTGESGGDSDQEQKFAGYAFGMPTTAVIALSLAAGLAALLGALDRRSGRGVPSAVPLALAATSFLVALGILIGKDTISPSGGEEVGVEIGLILGLITAALQTIVLGVVMAGRSDDEANTASPFGGDRSGYASPANDTTGTATVGTGHAAPSGGTTGYPTGQ